ncbi:hypothetical protein UO65_0105 [Actinokineospora spheciospongiae]|uniref:Uncharacterized protein n=1 Tax=Actinokineospora spheciospongiae TaxID=909613 RepID=W7IVW6_9PSEU|nr:hypothetical protein [Actinokineospora spheciospongiae]EWC64498.1 hypothetical protein UO65_0105 [Actinokineospora spheciospongiae]
MAEPDVPADLRVMWGARVDIERGHRLEAVAVHLCDDIAELREDGGLPDHVRTLITVLPQHRVLHIQVEGLSVETDPDRTTIRDVMNTLFELASDHNIITLDPTSPPLFTQHIVLVDPHGYPFAAKIGAGMGEPERLTP